MSRGRRGTWHRVRHRPAGTAARRALAALLAVVLTAGIGAIGAVAGAQPPEGLQATVDDLARTVDAPGAAISVIGPGGTTQTAVTGVDGRGAAVTADTPFVWGSVSKSTAAAVTGDLVRRGALAWDTTVQELVPGSAGLLGGQPVTVTDLVHHTSGLPHDVSRTDEWGRTAPATEVVGSLERPGDATAPGPFQYASFNYLVLQAVVETVTERPYAETLRSEVLDPADAGSAITGPGEFDRRVPPGFVPFFGDARPIALRLDGAGLGYGYLAGSISDLGGHARGLLTELTARAPATVRTDQGKEYGPGLYREEFGDQVVWWHSGAVPGYYTFLGLVPGTGSAVVALVNRYGELEADVLAQAGRGLLADVLDRPDPGWFPAGSRSTGYLVLGALLTLVFGLVAAVTLAVLRLAGGPRARGLPGTCVRIGTSTVLGGGVLVAGLAGLPALVGIGLPVMWRWAPDAALLFWMVVAEIFLLTALVVAGDVLGYRAGRGAAPSTTTSEETT
ncbi:serine hydrolase domain-containing protein [Pseudonocardia sp. HH130630-07]|uniref:serine hydrolase domain-containing protein n=1 Tax=Pseudonocardia sp. HH130630-07 TaxID=1690815 RepID=UPI0008153A51|nr:serine hydrolase domain-containing protein [Pseudonocardia sp. HH130630-07]ANY06018.1 hypothetical protein AFB00_06530 [Pseudonocardia sp. HH130630-07]